MSRATPLREVGLDQAGGELADDLLVMKEDVATVALTIEVIGLGVEMRRAAATILQKVELET